MAVEMAKLSLWLMTLAKDRPFTFLDHQLRSATRCSASQASTSSRAFHPEPGSLEATQQRFYDPKEAIEPASTKRSRSRSEIAAIDVRTLRDADRKRDLQRRARGGGRTPRSRSRTRLSGAMLASAGSPATLDGRLRALGDRVRGRLRLVATSPLSWRAAQPLLDTDLPNGELSRRPLHWPLAYPEVFLRDHHGFDTIIGNPPFLGGQADQSGALVTAFASTSSKRGWRSERKRGSCRLLLPVSRRPSRENGTMGLLATNTGRATPARWN